MKKTEERNIVARTKDWKEIFKALGSSHVTYVTSTPNGYIYVSNYDSTKFAEHLTR